MKTSTRYLLATIILFSMMAISAFVTVPSSLIVPYILFMVGSAIILITFTSKLEEAIS